jgi:hypothetical protein
MPGRHPHRLTADALARAGAAAGRGVLRLVPTERRDWAEAIWAEAYEVSAGWPRLAWRAGSLGLMVKEGQMVRRIGMLVLFAAAAGAAAWGAWPGSPVSHGTALQGGIIITLALLAGLPLLVRRWLGPPVSRAARWLRAGFFAAILALLPVQAAIGLFVGMVPRSGINRHTFDVAIGAAIPGSSSGGPNWGGETGILIVTACAMTVVLALTARRTPVAPATLIIGAGAGLVLGIAMYAIAPAGLNVKYPNRPWLHGSAAEAAGVLAWFLIFGAPLIAGAIAGRCCPVPDDPEEAIAARAWQGFAAGVVASGVGAVFVTVFGSATTALLIKSAWVRDVFYYGQHVTASAAYGRELYASQNIEGYFILLVGFPVIGLCMGLLGTAVANPAPRLPPDGGRRVNAASA